MKFVDAHIHLSDEEYADCVEEIITNAKKANVVALVSNSMDLKTSIESLKLAEKYRGMVYAALGVHPWSVQTLTDEELLEVIELVSEKKAGGKLVAVGEVGLDIKYEKIWDKQLRVFEEMLRVAERLALPVIIHSRGTTTQIVDILPSYSLKKVLLHWFSNPISALTNVIEKGYYITEGPPAVYSNGIQEVVRRIPLTNLLTETDGPVRFFRQPFNGKRTSPALIPAVVEAIAKIKKVSVEEAAEQIAKNFTGFFGVKLN
jgi:TatD DNase family protein